jgi:hypothetical protein
MTPGQDLRIALGHVRDEVLTSTARRQEPYVTGSLGGGTVAITGPAPKPAPLPQLSEAERAWATVQDSTSIAVLETFRRQYGASNPFYDRLAEARIKGLTKQNITTLKAERDREMAEEDKKRMEAAGKREEPGLFNEFLEWSKKQKNRQ